MSNIYGSDVAIASIIEPDNGITVVNRPIAYRKNTAAKVQKYITEVLGFNEIDTQTTKGTITPHTIYKRRKERGDFEPDPITDWSAIIPQLKKPKEKLDESLQIFKSLLKRTKYNETKTKFTDDDDNIAYLIYNDARDISPQRYGAYLGTLLADIGAITHYDSINEFMTDIAYEAVCLLAEDNANVMELAEYAPYAPLPIYATLTYITAYMAICGVPNKIDPDRINDSILPIVTGEGDIRFEEETPRGISAIIIKPGMDEKTYSEIRDNLTDIMKIKWLSNIQNLKSKIF